MLQPFDDESAIDPWLDDLADKTPKDKAIAALLANIESVSLSDVCKSIGWHGKDQTSSPMLKHIKVAIVHVLLLTAKKHNWHLIHDGGFFYIYNGAYWVALEDSEVKQLLKRAACKMGYPDIECRDSAFVDKLFQQAIQEGFFTERNSERQSIINLKNGSLLLNGDGVTLKPFDHRDFLTHQLDFTYDDKAVNPLFLNYLVTVLPDPETRKTLQQVAGYIFVKGLKMELVFFLFGFGANGKSVFFEVFTGVVGVENVSNYSIESLTNDGKYDRAMIKDKIVNYGTDVKLTSIEPSNFKTLASGEPIQARLPYRNPFIMRDYAKLIFNVNRMESANIEHTHGFYRRLLIIPFNQTIADGKQDRDLHTKILANKAGVLNWIVDGAREVIKNRNIFISDECRTFKARFLKESDSVAMFEEHIRQDLHSSLYYEMVNVAYKAYREFCIDSGNKPLGRNNFSKRMEALGFEKNVKDSGTYLEKHYLDKMV